MVDGMEDGAERPAGVCARGQERFRVVGWVRWPRPRQRTNPFSSEHCKD